MSGPTRRVELDDSESFNANLKRSLLSDRAPSRGWERQLFDYHAFAILHNSINWARS